MKRILHSSLGWIEPTAYSRNPPPGDPNRLPASRTGIRDSFSSERPVLLVRNPTVVVNDDPKGK
jgi:hypothetical protein